MKFLSSSSSSASSTTTTTTTFDGNVCNSKNATAGCLSAMFRRLLCFNTLPTCPSDQIKFTDMNSSTEYDKLRSEEKIEPRETPGIVARLMGLESMPQIDFVNTQLSLSSLSRSRSMNSMEEIESKQGRHRRVKSSLSFRESPTFSAHEEGNFFVLSFEDLDEARLSSSVKISSEDFAELKPRKAEHCRNNNNNNNNNKNKKNMREKKNKENQDPNWGVVSDEKLKGKINHKLSQNVRNNGKVGDSNNTLRPTRNCNGSSIASADDVKHSNSIITHKELRKKKKNKENCPEANKVETECESENTSPVSVLDFGEFITDPGIATSEEDSRLKGSNSRRSLSIKLVNDDHPSPSNANNPIRNDQEKKTIQDRCHGLKNTTFYQSRDYAGMLAEAREMAAEELIVSNWRYRETWTRDDFEDIGADLGSQIFQELLTAFVDQLAERERRLMSRGEQNRPNRPILTPIHEKLVCYSL